jgi:hypothetical protein
MHKITVNGCYEPSPNGRFMSGFPISTTCFIYRTGTYPAWTFLMNDIPTRSHPSSWKTHTQHLVNEKRRVLVQKKNITKPWFTLVKRSKNHTHHIKKNTQEHPGFFTMFPCVVPRCRRRGLVFLPHEFEAHAMRRLLAHHHLAVRQATESLKLYDWAMKKYRELTCYNGL